MAHFMNNVRGNNLVRRSAQEEGNSKFGIEFGVTGLQVGFNMEGGEKVKEETEKA